MGGVDSVACCSARSPIRWCGTRTARCWCFDPGPCRGRRTSFTRSWSRLMDPPTRRRRSPTPRPWRAFEADLWLAQAAETTQVTEDPSAAEQLIAEYRQLAQEADAYLLTLTDRLRQDGIRVHPRVLAGFMEDELLHFEQEAAADLVVMATHGRSGLRRVVSRSLAERLVR